MKIVIVRHQSLKGQKYNSRNLSMILYGIETIPLLKDYFQLIPLAVGPKYHLKQKGWNNTLMKHGLRVLQNLPASMASSFCIFR